MDNLREVALLRSENERLKTQVEMLQAQIRKYIGSQMEERSSIVEQNKEDEALFRMMREPHELSDGAVRVVIRGGM